MKSKYIKRKFMNLSIARAKFFSVLYVKYLYPWEVSLTLWSIFSRVKYLYPWEVSLAMGSIIVGGQLLCSSIIWWITYNEKIKSYLINKHSQPWIAIDRGNSTNGPISARSGLCSQCLYFGCWPIRERKTVNKPILWRHIAQVYYGKCQKMRLKNKTLTFLDDYRKNLPFLLDNIFFSKTSKWN